MQIGMASELHEERTRHNLWGLVPRGLGGGVVFGGSSTNNKDVSAVMKLRRVIYLSLRQIIGRRRASCGYRFTVVVIVEFSIVL